MAGFDRQDSIAGVVEATAKGKVYLYYQSLSWVGGRCALCSARLRCTCSCCLALSLFALASRMPSGRRNRVPWRAGTLDNATFVFERCKRSTPNRPKPYFRRQSSCMPRATNQVLSPGLWCLTASRESKPTLLRSLSRTWTQARASRKRQDYVNSVTTVSSLVTTVLSLVLSSFDNT